MAPLTNSLSFKEELTRYGKKLDKYTKPVRDFVSIPQQDDTNEELQERDDDDDEVSIAEDFGGGDGDDWVEVLNGASSVPALAECISNSLKLTLSYRRTSTRGTVSCTDQAQFTISP